MIAPEAAQPDPAKPLAERILAGESILIVGDAGVGKSHTAARTAERLSDEGWGSEHVVGSVSIQTVRFGAIAHLIGDAESRSPDELAARAQGHLTRLGHGQPTVLVIDDLDFLDHGSLALIHRLAVTGMPIIATVRTAQAASDEVLAFWKDGVLTRHDFAADPANTATVAGSFLDAPPSDAVVNALAALSLGNPLFIRELIADGLANGRLVERSGAIELDGELATAQRVSDLLAHRFANLPDSELEALEAIAVAEPIALSASMVALEQPAVEALEAARLVNVSRLGEDEVLSVAHPLIGELVRSALPTIRRRRHIATMCSAIFDDPAPRPVDLVRAVAWTIEGGQQPPHDSAIAAARHALATFDGATAREAIEAVTNPDEADSPTLEMLGRALLQEGKLDIAQEHLRAAEQRAASDLERALASARLSELLLMALGDADGAVEVLHHALDELDDLHARAHVVSVLMAAGGIGGDWRPALELGRPIVAEPGLDDAALLSMLVMTTIGQAMTGDVADVHADVERGLALAERHRTTHPPATDQLLVTQSLLYVADGRLDLAVETTRNRLAALGDDAALTTLVQMSVAQAEVFTGNIAEAIKHAVDATRRGSLDPLGLHPLANAVMATAFAMGGDVDASERASDRALGDPRTSAREQSFLGRALAHRLAFQNDLDEAVRACESAVAASGQNHGFAMPLIHDLVRFGRPEPAIAMFNEREQFRERRFFGLFAVHASALIEREPTLLRKVSDEFVTIGAILYAAEAAAQASTYARAAGEIEAADRDATRAHALMSRCDGAWSLSVGEVAPALSTRETEVAQLAADGTSTADIAEQLFVSTRTVDNHLQRVYKKLGLNSRDQLGPIFL